jgi:hypothetical protein
LEQQDTIIIITTTVTSHHHHHLHPPSVYYTTTAEYIVIDIMTDNCSNFWGCYLADIDMAHLRRSSFTTEDNNSILNSLKVIVGKSCTKDFCFDRVTTCGSEANLHAVITVTDGDTNHCLIAAGSYVAGDEGLIQGWSTSTFALKNGLSGVTNPSVVKNLFTLVHTVPLPYSIKGVMDEVELKEYENACMQEIHVKCLMGCMKGSPYKCILMELMLASNGAELSERALEMLGKLAEQHNITFIVDEVMTGGRCGSMLMTLSKPKIFIKRVTHITLGKWLHFGIIISSCHYRELKEQERESDHTCTRGASTKLDVRQVILYWTRVSENLKFTESRRSMVIQRLHVDPEDTWGEGCLIFAPVRRNGAIQGLKNRFLPKLEPNLPIEKSLRCTKMSEWSKAHVNQMAVNSIRLWINLNKNLIYDEVDSEYYKVVKYLSSNDVEVLNKLQDLQFENFPEIRKNQVQILLRRAEKYGLLKYKMIGFKRLRYWVVNDICSTKNFIVE